MFTCSKCGYQSIKWLGKCPVCDSWESFEEITMEKRSGMTAFREKSIPKLLKEVAQESVARTGTGMLEFDRVLGGGIVKGGVVLVGGEPGVGKSTLLLEVAGRLSKKNKVLYVSAEESLQQITLRAQRLGMQSDSLYMVSEEDITVIQEHLEKNNFDIAIIDSVQAVYHPHIENSRGSLNQVRGCAEWLTRFAKHTGISIFIVGHVTKEGAIAGPKLLEHIVDCVLYFESENTSHYRILRATKNRFGSTGELAVFEMTSKGLGEVTILSDIFLPHKNKSVAGSCIGCVMEGLKPLLLELQALVGPASFGVVRRRSLGFDFNRFSLLIATIEKRLKVSLASQDVFLNVAGGIKVTDPAADLAAVCAILSSLKDTALESNTVFIGEIGLTGELRPVSNIVLRLKEVEKGGFKKCFIPSGNLKEVSKNSYTFDLIGVESIKHIFD